MMNSPLLAGNDLRNMTKETVDILTNKELIAINQDINFVQARRLLKEGDIELWVKPLGKRGKQKAVAILNRSEKEISYTLSAEKAGIKKKNRIRDLWQHKDLGKIGNEKIFIIPKHGIVMLRVE